MRKRLQSGLLVFLSSLAISNATAPPAPALSDDMKRFIALALAGSNFIDEAGSTAIANGGTVALQQFARAAITEQLAMRRRLAQWDYVLRPTPAEPIVYQDQWEYGPIGLLFLPLNAAVAAGSFVIYRSLGVTSVGVVLRSDAQAQLKHLQELTEAEFNSAYRASRVRHIKLSLRRTMDILAPGKTLLYAS